MRPERNTQHEGVLCLTITGEMVFHRTEPPNDASELAHYSRQHGGVMAWVVRNNEDYLQACERASDIRSAKWGL